MCGFPIIGLANGNKEGRVKYSELQKWKPPTLNQLPISRLGYDSCFHFPVRNSSREKGSRAENFSNLSWSSFSSFSSPIAFTCTFSLPTSFPISRKFPLLLLFIYYLFLFKASWCRDLLACVPRIILNAPPDWRSNGFLRFPRGSTNQYFPLGCVVPRQWTFHSVSPLSHTYRVFIFSCTLFYYSPSSSWFPWGLLGTFSVEYVWYNAREQTKKKKRADRLP